MASESEECDEEGEPGHRRRATDAYWRSATLRARLRRKEAVP
jgi:hypothetical protein